VTLSKSSRARLPASSPLGCALPTCELANRQPIPSLFTADLFLEFCFARIARFVNFAVGV
jgi:hypothetical protein